MPIRSRRFGEISRRKGPGDGKETESKPYKIDDKVFEHRFPYAVNTGMHFRHPVYICASGYPVRFYE